MASTSCLTTPTAVASVYTLSDAAQLAVATPTSFVKRNRAKLELDGSEFRVQGPNVYWLGLDENVVPNPSYPSKSRVLEIMAVAKVMGATTIRSTSLGVSFGTGLSIENALNTFKPDDSAAWDAIDFAVLAARSYGLRLVIPLTDQYDYYHGGIPTFLRWRNLSSTNYDPFYDLGGDVYQDFRRYISTLLTHRSPYTNLTLATEPAVLAFETGNELGGYTGKHYPPPVAWTQAISEYLKELAPDTLVVSGSYGVRKDELALDSIDIHSDHFYPTYRSRLSSSAAAAHSARKPFLVGEYDWTNQYYSRYRWGYFVLLLPVVFALGVWFSPKRWWPWTFSVWDVLTCGCCCKNRRKKRRKPYAAGAGGDGSEGGGEYDRMGDSAALSPGPLDDPKPFDAGFERSDSTTSVPILLTAPPSSSSTRSFPRPRRDRTRSSNRSRARAGLLLDRPLRIGRAFVSGFVVLLALPLFGIIYTFLPTPISPFLASLSSLSTTTSSSDRPSAVGDLYWSLLGRTDSGCRYVPHDDGYTLHYPTDPTAPSSSGSSPSSGSGGSVVELTKHAWKTRRDDDETPFWAGPGFDDLDRLEWRHLPVVAFPQRGIRLANGTVVGGA
ncbi:hypothetical protein JCM11491_003804 [Sporobolomyces phaffii]